MHIAKWFLVMTLMMESMLTRVVAIPVVLQVKTVFVIAMENHNFTQPIPTNSPQQILGNPAAPYINSLITPGNSNAAQVSYATKYYNAGRGVHPSEPNYVWAEAGTDFGVYSDLNPGVTNNVFNAPHLTRQLNTAGIPWKNYQEDIQFSPSPIIDASGTIAAAINPYYGAGQIGYAARHNPMGFFTDTQTQNVYPLTNLANDLVNNAAGRYNWITPNLYNDMHTPLSGGFTYQGVSYTGDQASVAQGDNFLATIIPIIMASPAYQDHGVIIIRWDETETGDGTDHTIPEIIISPMAKGNAYVSSLEMSHSSDVKTMDEIFGLPLLTNAIPAGDINAAGTGYNNVSTVNDLSDMFTGVPSMYIQQPAGANLANGISTVAFGTVNVGTNVSKAFVVTNAGSATLVLSGFGLAGSNPGDFSVSGISLPAVLSSGGSLTFQVTFSPVAGGSRSASFLITNNDSSHNPFIVNLSGNGNTPPILSVPSTIHVQATNLTMNTANYTVTAVDAVDGSITPVVTPASGSSFPIGTNTVTAIATDSGGLRTTNTFLVIVQRQTAPVIVLNGSANLTAWYHVPFVDPGATAYDLLYGTVPIVTRGSVNVNNIGTYTLQYIATDTSSGNATTNNRTVNVVALVTPNQLQGAMMPSGGFAISFNIGSNQPYHVMASANPGASLSTWTQVTSGLAVAGTVVYVDAKILNSRFYRVISP